jgi:hypothetical protein
MNYTKKVLASLPDSAFTSSALGALVDELMASLTRICSALLTVYLLASVAFCVVSFFAVYPL